MFAGVEGAAANPGAKGRRRERRRRERRRRERRVNSQRLPTRWCQLAGSFLGQVSSVCVWGVGGVITS